MSQHGPSVCFKTARIYALRRTEYMPNHSHVYVLECRTFVNRRPVGVTYYTRAAGPTGALLRERTHLGLGAGATILFQTCSIIRRIQALSALAKGARPCVRPAAPAPGAAGTWHLRVAAHDVMVRRPSTRGAHTHPALGRLGLGRVRRAWMACATTAAIGCIAAHEGRWLGLPCTPRLRDRVATRSTMILTLTPARRADRPVIGSRRSVTSVVSWPVQGTYRRLRVQSTCSHGHALKGRVSRIHEAGRPSICHGGTAAAPGTWDRHTESTKGAMCLRRANTSRRLPTHTLVPRAQLAIPSCSSHQPLTCWHHCCACSNAMPWHMRTRPCAHGEGGVLCMQATGQDKILLAATGLGHGPPWLIRVSARPVYICCRLLCRRRPRHPHKEAFSAARRHGVHRRRTRPSTRPQLDRPYHRWVWRGGQLSARGTSAAPARAACWRHGRSAPLPR